MPTVLTVKQLNTYVKTLIEGDSRLSFISVGGEISNFKNHYSSGHLYFSLKDNDALIKCVMFKGNAQALKFTPKDGMQVICSGRVSLYEKDGQFQFYADRLVPDGIGDLAQQFKEIKEKLEKEGLFDTAYKRALPKFPSNIAVITSDTGAAVQDIINIISRRYPICKITLYPVLVQGDNAVQSIISALDTVYESENIDVIILGRGGGSAEDLWAFNSEALARKIYESPIPIISAVGHETDFSISDFVADMRAPTPSAAAELAVPDLNELRLYLKQLTNRAKNSLNNTVSQCEAEYNKCMQSVSLLKPESMLDNKFILLDRTHEKLLIAIGSFMNKKENELQRVASKLDTISPLKVLSRGYAAIEKNSSIVTTVNTLHINDVVRITFNDGYADGKILLKEKNQEKYNG